MIIHHIQYIQQAMSFSPEFLIVCHVEDNIFPSLIVVGGNNE